MGEEAMNEIMFTIDCSYLDQDPNHHSSLPSKHHVVFDTQRAKFDGLEVLKLSGFLRGEESHIISGELVSRAGDIGGMIGYRHGIAIVAQSKRLPAQWRAHRLALPGAGVVTDAGTFKLPYLHYKDGLWCFGFAHWLDRWTAVDRLVRVAHKLPKSAK